MQNRANEEQNATDRAIDEIHQFWFGEPARDEEEMQKKVSRWFMGDEAMDTQIRTRFGHLVEAALRDELSAFQTTTRGRLALILLLDQFTRNIFRNTPRAYQGDSKALSLALAELDRGTHHVCSAEAALFVVTPLVHAENLALQTRGVELSRAIAERAPLHLRRVFEQGAVHTENYRTIIARFGRFPHRNDILGRPSSEEEMTFLASQSA